MTGWLAPLRAALDDAARPVSFFFRDDDAGWGDQRLLALLDLFARRATPIDLAAIPAAMTSGLAAELRRRSAAAHGLLGIHQHGYAHVDHEHGGRRCEFGARRPRDAQRADIAHGRSQLRRHFGPLLQPIFTPPWNRCTPATASCLVELGVAVLSRDRSAGTLALTNLRELPVAVDWLARRAGRRLPLATLGELLAARACEPAPVGVMLHHAVMGVPDRRAVDALLELLTSHDAARCRTMATVLEETAA